jgi:tRNA threonylcarbamoyl adenosine modification protein YjeE
MIHPSSLTIQSGSEDETAALARRLAPVLAAGDVVTFDGDLGTGKTFFIRALCAALEVPREAGVSSPSYAMVNLYEGGQVPIAHLDLYRLSDEHDLEGLGFRDLMDGSRLVLVEWPGQVGGLHDVATLEIALVDRGPTTREITFRWADLARQATIERALNP